MCHVLSERASPKPPYHPFAEGLTVIIWMDGQIACLIAFYFGQCSYSFAFLYDVLQLASWLQILWQIAPLFTLEFCRKCTHSIWLFSLLTRIDSLEKVHGQLLFDAAQ